MNTYRSVMDGGERFFANNYHELQTTWPVSAERRVAVLFLRSASGESWETEGVSHRRGIVCILLRNDLKPTQPRRFLILPTEKQFSSREISLPRGTKRN